MTRNMSTRSKGVRFVKEVEAYLTGQRLLDLTHSVFVITDKLEKERLGNRRYDVEQTWTYSGFGCDISFQLFNDIQWRF